jgi:GT2 family glycosyltransferase
MPSENPAPEVSIIVVNYHTETEVLRLLESAHAHAPFPEYHFILVDNSPDHGVEFPLCPRDVYLPQETNIGFGPACNAGAKASSAPYIFLANPDLEFTGTLNPLTDAIRGDVVAVCPLIDPPDFFQNRHLPTLFFFTLDFMGLHKIFPENAFREYYFYHPPRTSPFDVDQPAAAALLFSRDRFMDLEGFDPEFIPAWWEDVDLFARVFQAGWKAECHPHLKVRHTAGVAARQLGRSRFLDIYGRNCVRYFRKHRGMPALWGIKLVLFTGLALRALLGKVSPALPFKVWTW